jgi:AcrR family transcriptional regulator
MALRATPDKKEEKERTRLALLRAALRLGYAHGFSSLGLREVSRAAAIAPTSFYRHFSDMQELGLALVEDLVGPLLAGVGVSAERAAAASEDMVLAVIRAVFEGATNDPELTRFTVAELVGSSPELRRALRVQVSGLAATLRRLADAGERSPAVPRELAEAAVTLLLDGSARALEGTLEARASLSDALALPLRRLLARSPAGSRP